MSHQHVGLGVNAHATDDQKPHIAVIGHLAGDRVFGAERSLLDVLAAADPGQFRLSCILPADSEVYLRAVARYTTSIVVFPYRAWSRFRPFQGGTIDRFEQIFRRLKIDLVHVNTIVLQAPLVAASRLGIPRIVHARELINQDRTLAWRFAMSPAAVVHRVQAAADIIIANSQATQTLYGRGKNTALLYNCVDSARFDMPNDPEPGKLKVGIISSNIPKKGISFFVELALAAADSIPELEFFVIGPRNAYVERLASNLRQASQPARLRFIDYVSDPVDAVRMVNVVTSFSIVAESFGRTLAEAMAARRPVIAFERGAVGELIRHGVDGFIVPFADIGAVLGHLKALANSRDLVQEMGRRGRQRADHLFSTGGFARGLNGIYRRVLAGRQRLPGSHETDFSPSPSIAQMVKVSSP